MIFVPVVTIWLSFLAEHGSSDEGLPPGTDLRPLLARLVESFPTNSRATTLEEAIDLEVLPNIPNTELAAWMRDQLISLAIAVGARPAGDGHPSVDAGTLTRMGSERPFTMPHATGPLVQAFPWVAREILRRLSVTPYPIVLEDLHLSTGAVYHTLEAPDGIPCIIYDMWQRLRMVWSWGNKAGVLEGLSWVQARDRAVRTLTFAPGVGRGGPILSIAQHDEGSWHLFLEDGWQLIPLGDVETTREVGASMGVDVEQEIIDLATGKKDRAGLALLNADRVPVLLMRTASFFGRPSIRRTVPEAVGVDVIRRISPVLERWNYYLPSLWADAVEIDENKHRYDEIADSFDLFVRENATADGIEESEIEAWAVGEGLEYLGSGSSRAVVGIHGHALKLDFDVMSREGGGNRNEIEVWDRSPERIRRHLVPILARADDSRWLLMEKAETGGRMSDEVKAELDACGITDFQSANVSMDGRLLDYGFIFDDEAWEACVKGSS